MVDKDLPFSVVNSDSFQVNVDIGCPPTDKIICGRLVQSSKTDEMKWNLPSNRLKKSLVLGSRCPFLDSEALADGFATRFPPTQAAGSFPLRPLGDASLSELFPSISFTTGSASVGGRDLFSALGE